MTLPTHNSRPPTVHVVGQIDHPDFRDPLELLRASFQLEIAADISPELVVIAQCRPGDVRHREVESLQRRWPLSGVVALLSSWCEGETRTGRPWPGVKRLYWYEFPAWWRRQLALRAAGRCPDWARRPAQENPPSTIRNPKSEIRDRGNGVIVLNAPHRHTANTLTDVLRHAGYAMIWQPRRRPGLVVRGVAAGIWDGGQLDDREAADLTEFCRKMAPDATPVVALLDFPRRDRVDHALAVGAAAVLGKPWLNEDFVATIETVANHRSAFGEATISRAA